MTCGGERMTRRTCLCGGAAVTLTLTLDTDSPPNRSTYSYKAIYANIHTSGPEQSSVPSGYTSGYLCLDFNRMIWRDDSNASRGTHGVGVQPGVGTQRGGRVPARSAAVSVWPLRNVKSRFRRHEGSSCRASFSHF